jgi:hypothetical protein
VLCKCYQHLRDCMNRYVDINKAISVNLSRPGCHGSWMTEAAGPWVHSQHGLLCWGVWGAASKSKQTN